VAFPDPDQSRSAVIRQLQTRLALPLPGQEAQFRMAHLQRIAEMPMRDDVRNAAVLLLLYQKDDAWHLVFIRRKSITGDIHGGQISFPGGRVQKHESYADAALRESEEEIASPADKIELIGQLTRLHIPVSNHIVYPVVGFLPKYFGWHPQPEEVEEILEVPLRHFLDPATRVLAPIRLKEGILLKDVPCFVVGEYLVWGATAMIMNEFMEILGQIESLNTLL
jgi:8-oxo-dGTP pyrophosphatase MutT (NUDIX family)